ncbi:MAG TPA: hypothetical protein VG815_00740, partial [Chloroflexota bacterium]|nr:hypothetical protein [Chloroflexota bacterium]
MIGLSDSIPNRGRTRAHRGPCWIWLASLSLALIVLLPGCGGSGAAPNGGTTSGTGPIVVSGSRSAGSRTTGSETRSKPGTLFIRGSVPSVGRYGFTLSSPSKGLFRVDTSSLTTYSRKTQTVSASTVQVGTHVGVHGYLSGRTLTAVKVTIYVEKRKAKPKEHTIRGTVIRAGADWIDVALGSQRFHFVLAPHASVIYRLLPAQLTSAKAGQRVDVREYQAGAQLLATRVELLVIHVHHPRAHTQHGLVGSLFAGGFILNSVSGQRLVILYSGAVQPQEKVSVRGWSVSGGFHADKVRQILHLVYHHPLAHTEHGLVGNIFAGGFILDSVTGQRVVILYSGTVQLQEKVSVRGWAVTGGFHAEKVRQILHLVYHHPPAHTEHGLVGSLIAGGFTLNTVSGQRMVVLYTGSVQAQEQVSVRGWAVTGGFHAQKVRRIFHLAVHTVLVRGYVSAVGSGWVLLTGGDASLLIDFSGTTHVTVSSVPGTTGDIKKGQYISVRYWHQGQNRIATSVHVYAHVPVPRATGAIKGTVNSVAGTTIEVRAGTE